MIGKEEIELAALKGELKGLLFAARALRDNGIGANEVILHDRLCKRIENLRKKIKKMEPK